ncbi:hypothetical protein DEI82_10040 [Curtobacterium sp. MCBD17_019]|nr:hypothetical protein DEI82_10040 [Curtobacterium sp. MCBD17_019]
MVTSLDGPVDRTRREALLVGHRADEVSSEERVETIIGFHPRQIVERVGPGWQIAHGSSSRSSGASGSR